MKVSCACSVTNWEATCETRVRCHVSRVVYMSYTSWYRGTRYNRPYELVLCGQFPCRSTCFNKILYRVCKAFVSLRLYSRVVPEVLIAQISVDIWRLRRDHHDWWIPSPSRCENGFWTQISSNLLISESMKVDKRLSYYSYFLCRKVIWCYSIPSRCTSVPNQYTIALCDLTT